VLLSVRAGLRAKEIALATWWMVTDAEAEVGDALDLVNELRRGGTAAAPYGCTESCATPWRR